MKYKVTITATSSMEIEVEANSAEEAEHIADEMVNQNDTGLVDLAELEYESFEYEAEETDE